MKSQNVSFEFGFFSYSFRQSSPCKENLNRLKWPRSSSPLNKITLQFSGTQFPKYNLVLSWKELTFHHPLHMAATLDSSVKAINRYSLYSREILGNTEYQLQHKYYFCTFGFVSLLIIGKYQIIKFCKRESIFSLQQ